ncbi:BnaC08g44260D [Brassica napus]|uniref:BnaC08g44260D protein n=3 Tax=Brassica TaxID=3705 RepID=A0A078F6E8_BRANA|nr:BnaC08g44260D [Brassica napus]VDD59473.1 unnamed protein product [Brassica oleracea]
MSPTTCRNAQRSQDTRQGERSLPSPESEKMSAGALPSAKNEPVENQQSSSHRSSTRDF